MNLFRNYKTELENILGKKPDYLEKGRRAAYALLSESQNFSSPPSTGDRKSKTILEIDSNQLEKYFGPNIYSFNSISIGNHPDFQDLEEDQILKHHCVSMFVDIKGSTRLQLKYSLEEVRLIKDTLLTLCINIVSHFGGHVHRLQGDAVFVQFVRKNQNPNNSIINALNAGSVICQAVSEDLSSAFETYGLDPIKIRVGIDYGSNDKVMWSYYGIQNCNELTTTSIHTDLAAKLQHKASVNSIRIGKNVVDSIAMREDFINVPTFIEGGVKKNDPYILQSNELNYKQFDFNWKKYLKSFSFYRENNRGELKITENRFSLKALIYDENKESDAIRYFENNYAILKGKKIKFELMFNGMRYHKKIHEKIVWQAFNFGAEAKAVKDLKHSFNHEFRNKTVCIANAEYHGNHYLKCTIQREFSNNIVLKFPLYIDNTENSLVELREKAFVELKDSGLIK